MRDRLVAAAMRVISRMAPSGPNYRMDESLSAIAKLGAGDELLPLMRDAATAARISVDPELQQAATQDRSLARLRPVECTPPESCSLGAEHTLFGWEPVFIRDCPRRDVSKLQHEMLKCWGTILHLQLARPRRIDVVGDQLSIVSDRIAGVSLDRVGPLAPPIALALLADARTALEVLHAAGMTHGALRPKRVRIAASGHVCLCYGADAVQCTSAEDHAALARMILSTAFDDRLLFEILEAGDAGACTVACDRLEELEPGLDELAVAALRSDGGPDRVLSSLARIGMREAASALMAVAMEEVGA